ncbi:MAG: porin family protein [Dysgonomonas sp.]|nr:porin family protein [Dysgonomonas sp.]
MKTIVRTSLIGILLLLCITINAQEKPVTFGVKAGMNITNLTGDVDDNNAKIGFNVGVTVDYALTPDIFLLSGLEYATKGTKFDGDVKLNLSYIQLPIHVGYKLTVSDGLKIGFHAGPYIAYGVDGKWNAKADGVSVDLDTFGDDALLKMKRFDFGLGGGVGLEFGKFNAGINYDLGLVNIADFGKIEIEDDWGGVFDGSDVSLKNVAAYITVGYKF